MPNYLQILAKNINYFLEEKHLRPAWLAEKSGIKPPNISKILSQFGNPTLETIGSLATALDLEVQDLVKYYSSSTECDLVLAVRDLEKAENQLYKAKYNLKASLSERPRTKEHPIALQKEIEGLLSRITSLNRKIAFLNKILEEEREAARLHREKLDRKQFGEEFLSKINALSESGNDQQSPKDITPQPQSREQSILNIQSKLNGLTDRELQQVAGFIDDIKVRRNRSGTSSSDAI